VGPNLCAHALFHGKKIVENKILSHPKSSLKLKIFYAGVILKICGFNEDFGSDSI
jgi:hypothetical protein